MHSYKCIFDQSDASFDFVNKTSHKILLGKLSTYDHIWTFGYLCYGHVYSKLHDKFAPRAKPGVFVGYPHGQKGYKIYDLIVNRFMYLGMFSSWKTSIPSKTHHRHLVPLLLQLVPP